jgi:hypothetical protein
MINGSDGRIRNRHIPARPDEYLGGRAAGISCHARPRDFVGCCDRSSWRVSRRMAHPISGYIYILQQ